MTPKPIVQRGYTLVELMVAMSIGIILIGAVIVVYLAQTRIYKVVNSNSEIQNSENAIAALVAPAVRAVGFVGCSNMLQPPLSFTSNLNAGGPPPVPVGTQPPASMLFGYDASGTAGNGTLTLTTLNAANSAVATQWTPNLDASLLSSVETGSDVLLLFGATPGSQPVAVTSIAAGSSTLSVLDASGLAAGQLAAVSDCGKSTVFNITNVAGTTLTHAAAAGAQGNANAAFPFSVSYNTPLLVPMQQTAIYVAQGQAGQSVLMLATYSSGAWTALPLVPGVDTMQVLYGTGAQGVVSQYVPASAGLNWSSVYSVRLAFLLEGQIGSAGTGNPTQFTVLGTTVTVPQDTRLRRVYEMTVKLRNAA
jgi:type IV pilus assembly protein PilW